MFDFLHAIHQSSRRFTGLISGKSVIRPKRGRYAIDGALREEKYDECASR